MTPFAEARGAVERHLQGAAGDLPQEDTLVILEEETIERPWGWVFFYTSRLWRETGDFRYALAGNAPLIVERDSGRILPTGTALPLEQYIENYERTGNPTA